MLRAVQPHIPTEDPDVLVRLRDLSDWLAYQLAVRRGRPMSSVLMVDPPSGRSHRDRGLRRLHALTRRRGALARFPAEIVPEEYQADAFSGWERLELSPPLSAVPYLSYPVVLEEGPYRRLRALIWGGSSEPGGLIGIELVDPSGAIRLHEVASLPSVDTPIDLEFDAQSLVIDEAGTYELRVFARNARTAHLLERVDRGVRRIDRPRARPMVVLRAMTTVSVAVCTHNGARFVARAAADDPRAGATAGRGHRVRRRLDRRHPRRSCAPSSSAAPGRAPG